MGGAPEQLVLHLDGAAELARIEAERGRAGIDDGALDRRPDLEAGEGRIGDLRLEQVVREAAEAGAEVAVVLEGPESAPRSFTSEPVVKPKMSVGRAEVSLHIAEGAGGGVGLTARRGISAAWAATAEKMRADIPLMTSLRIMDPSTFGVEAVDACKAP